MLISENIKIYMLETCSTTIFVEYIQEQEVCLFAISNKFAMCGKAISTL